MKAPASETPGGEIRPLGLLAAATLDTLGGELRVLMSLSRRPPGGGMRPPGLLAAATLGQIGGGVRGYGCPPTEPRDPLASNFSGLRGGPDPTLGACGTYRGPYQVFEGERGGQNEFAAPLSGLEGVRPQLLGAPPGFFGRAVAAAPCLGQLTTPSGFLVWAPR